MASHSSILAWKIPWTEEPGGPHSPWGHTESGVTERTAHNSALSLKQNPSAYVPSVARIMKFSTLTWGTGTAAVPGVQASSHSDVSQLSLFPTVWSFLTCLCWSTLRKLLEGSPVQASRALPLCSCLFSAPSVGVGGRKRGGLSITDTSQSRQIKT